MTATVERLCQCMAGLPWLSAPQIADMLRVPAAYWQDFTGLLRQGVERGLIEHRTECSGGCEIPMFRKA